MSNEQNLTLTYDLGTSLVKMVIFDQDYQVVYQDEQPIPSYQDEGWQYQKATDWWQAFKKLMIDMKNSREITAADIKTIVSTGQMEDCLLLDDKGKPLSEVLLYSDSRAEEEYQQILTEYGEQEIKEATGYNFDVLMSINKYLWLKKYNPEVFSWHEYLILGAKDYINFVLTGKNVTDYTNASVTGFYDYQSGSWNQELLETFDLDIDKLPELKPGSALVGYLRPEIRDTFGLSPATEVLNGAGDLAASTLGAGAWQPGDVYAYLGTTGWLASPTTGIKEDPAIYCLADPQGEGYITAGAILNAGDPYDWLLSTVLADQDSSDIKDEDYRKVEREMASVAPGSEGLLFLPFLKGERSPVKIKENSGAFLGLGSSHGKKELLRAVLEGVGYSLRHNLEEMLGEEEITDINLIGGGSKSTLWPQILADILAVRIKIREIEAGAPALGALLLSCFDEENNRPSSEKDFTDLLEVKETIEPKSAHEEIYQQGYDKYRSYLTKLYLSD